MLQAKSLLVYWASKGHNATVIFAKMGGYFGGSAPSYPWVTKWLRALTRGEDIFEPNERSGRPEDPVIGMKVINFLDLNPFASVRQIATATKIARSTVFDHVKGWGYTIKHLKWIPHDLTAAMMEQRVELSRKLLLTLRSAGHRGWTQFLTGDESWFWLTIDHEQ
jgi:hypothetical protein